MIGVLWRLTSGYRLTPWRSPYLKWRMETYWGLHAEKIDFAVFWRFSWQRRADLWRYLHWAAKRQRETGARPPQRDLHRLPPGDV